MSRFAPALADVPAMRLDSNLFKHIPPKIESGDNMADDKFDPDNPLPYGGITDVHGNIVKAITKEEHDAMLAKARKAFGKKR